MTAEEMNKNQEELEEKVALLVDLKFAKDISFCPLFATVEFYNTQQVENFFKGNFVAFLELKLSTKAIGNKLLIFQKRKGD